MKIIEKSKSKNEEEKQIIKDSRSLFKYMKTVVCWSCGMCEGRPTVQVESSVRDIVGLRTLGNRSIVRVCDIRTLHQFSNNRYNLKRFLIDKAVAGWTGKADIDHIQTVGDYLHHSCDKWVEPFQAVDLSPSARTDPLYAVIA